MYFGLVDKYCENWQFIVWFYGGEVHYEWNFHVVSSAASEILDKEDRSLYGFCEFGGSFWQRSLWGSLVGSEMYKCGWMDSVINKYSNC